MRTGWPSFFNIAGILPTLVYQWTKVIPFNKSNTKFIIEPLILLLITTEYTRDNEFRIQDYTMIILYLFTYN